MSFLINFFRNGRVLTILKTILPSDSSLVSLSKLPVINVFFKKLRIIQNTLLFKNKMRIPLDVLNNYSKPSKKRNKFHYVVKIHSGLGNRLFQISFIYSFAKNHKQNFGFLDEDRTSLFINRLKQLPNYKKEFKTYLSVKEPKRCYNQFINLKNIPENIIFEGYFQTEKYFKTYRTDIIKLLAEPKEITTLMNDKFSNLKWENCFFIHIRLGDHILNDYLWIDLTNYYIRCIDIILIRESDMTFLIFSDEPKRISEYHEHLLSKLDNQKYSIISEDTMTTLYMMSRCQLGGICANSTFSWWGAWLNKNKEKQIFMPSPWSKSENSSDIYFEGVNIIEI